MNEEILAAILNQVTQVSDDVSSLKTDMKRLVGNGKQGRVDLIEADIEKLQASKNRIYGANGAFVLLVTGWEFFKHWFKVN
ncbi:MAG TPA: hypothetical protein VNY51_10145 [Candidatus Dormibacteraeota bacterium]|nr:hypothetical protein [Candidatus Dormibacteraeota bacterium]